MGIIWDELTVLFMCLVAKQKYRLETGCSELHNTVFFANGGLNVHNLNRWTWALLIPTKDSEAQKLWFGEIQAQIATLLKPTDINKQMDQNSNGKKSDIYANYANMVWKQKSGCQSYRQRDWFIDCKKSLTKAMSQSSSIQVECILTFILFFQQQEDRLHRRSSQQMNIN